MNTKRIIAASILGAVALLAGCSKGLTSISTASDADQGPYPGHTFDWYDKPANYKAAVAQYRWCHKHTDVMQTPSGLPDFKAVQDFDATHPACAEFDRHMGWSPMNAAPPIPGLY
ncbi:MAG: hypothetical protein AB7S53_09170 [Thiomonas sp.]|jgi:hypothetical protein